MLLFLEFLIAAIKITIAWALETPDRHCAFGWYSTEAESGSRIIEAILARTGERDPEQLVALGSTSNQHRQTGCQTLGRHWHEPRGLLEDGARDLSLSHSRL
jgi:hypothetical protein